MPKYEVDLAVTIEAVNEEAAEKQIDAALAMTPLEGIEVVALMEIDSD